jgi:hypothetical protein
MKLNERALPILFTVLITAISTNSYSQTQSFRCNFSDGISTNWDSGKPSLTKDARMAEMVFDQLDTQKGSGRLIGNAGVENIQTLSGDKSIHIIEITPTRNMNITTIFAPVKKNPNLHPAVHSRHINLMGEPLTSQFVGLCNKLN